MISTLYRGSVKDLMGPVQTTQMPGTAAVVFEYSDAFSVFDWGKMPDLLTKKGQALAILAADLFERLEKPGTWKEFSRSPEALALRKANRFGGIFNELGEELQSVGLRTHYLGILDSPLQGEVTPKKSDQVKDPFRRLVVRQVSVVKPTLSIVLGRTVPDYFPTRNSPLPRLIPLEVVFRFSCPEGSSFPERVRRDAGYFASLGFPEAEIEEGKPWDFPVLELFTKLEGSDRLLSLSEALAISGLSARQLQEVLLKTAWVAGVLRSWCSHLGIEVADGKLEWGISEEGRSFLVDAIGPDELRLIRNGIQLSKEFLRLYFRKTSWFVAVEKAKAQSKTQGTADWKRWVQEQPPALTPHYRELGTQVYLVLANAITGKRWFPEAWSLEQLGEELAIAGNGTGL